MGKGAYIVQPLSCSAVLLLADMYDTAVLAQRATSETYLKLTKQNNVRGMFKEVPGIVLCCILFIILLSSIKFHAKQHSCIHIILKFLICAKAVFCFVFLHAPPT